MKPSIHLRVALLALSVAAGALAGCGGGGAALVPHSGGGSTQGKLANATLHIVIPEKTTNGKRRPLYISPATTQLAWTLDSAKQTPVALTTANPDCSNSGSGLSCAITFSVAPGTHTFTFTLEDANNNALSQATVESTPLAVATANTLNVTLGGITASLAISSANTNFVHAGTRYVVYGDIPVTLAINALDADGYTIAGAGAPSVSATIAPVPSSSPVTVTFTAGSNNTWTLTSAYQPTSPAQGGAMTLQVVASPYPSSGASPFPASFNLNFYTPWLFVGNTSGKVQSYDELGKPQSVTLSPSPGTPVAVAYGDTTLSTASPLPSPYLFVAAQVPGPTPTPVPSVGAGTPTASPGPTSTPSGAMYAYNGDGSVPALSGTFSGLGTPVGIAFDTNDLDVYVLNAIGTSLQAYTSQGAVVSLSAQSISNPTGIAFDSTNDDEYVSTGTGVYAYTENGSADSAVSSFSALSTPVGVAYDSHLNEILVLNGNGTVGLYAPTGGSPVATFSVSASPTAIAFDPYTQWIYVASASGIEAYSESGAVQSLSGGWASLGTPTSLTVAL